MGRQKKLFFSFLLALLPLVLLSMIELGLRLARYGDDLSLFITLEKNHKYWITNPKIGRRYFLSHDFLPATSYDAFLKEKPDNAFRIFVLGESAAAGFPYLNNGAFSRMLRGYLQQTHPDRLIEMVNLALPAVSSYALLDFADELVEYAPDAVLIYAGHNEFYGALGSASTESLGRQRWLIKLYLRVQQFKLVQLLKDSIFRLKARTAAIMKRQEEGTMMARLAGQKHIAYRGDLYSLTAQGFRDNLSEMIQIFKAHDIRVLLSDVVSNLGDLPPFMSALEARADRVEWQQLFERGLKLAQADSCERALHFFQQAAQCDSLHAGLRFQQAKCLARLERWDDAREVFTRARDLDGLPFRASSDFNRLIHEVGRKFEIPIVAMEAAFAVDSPHGIIGNHLLLEHVHPNLNGFLLMARTFAEEIERRGWLASRRTNGTLTKNPMTLQARGVTALDEEVAHLRSRQLTSNWPFTSDAARYVPLDYRPSGRMQELAYALLREQISWDQAHLQLAEYYLKNEQPELAAPEYEALVVGMPYVVAPYLRLGLTDLALERRDEAYAIFERSLSVEPSALAHKWMGAIEVNRGQISRGIDLLLQALQREPNDPETLYNISIGYAKAGDFAQAREYAERLVRTHPGYPGAAEHVRKLQVLQ